ncbi:MAG: glycosyl hydrolase family 18 protein [Ginsengibacter sp.]
MKLKLSLLVPVIILLLSCLKSQEPNDKSQFKIVGYYSLQSAMTDDLINVPFDKLTHINLWFLNPDSTGNFTQDFASLEPFINAAHAKNVKVLASIGGGSSHPYYHSLLKEDKRPMLINNLISIVTTHNMDGIDVDLEGSDIDENYENFVIDLAAALRSRNKMITAAIAVYYKDALSDKALAQYDFVNVMSYDRTGPWSPDKPGPHSTYANAVEDLEYFGTVRSIPKEKMVLGVPFYGYGYGPELTSPAISMDYGQILAEFPDAEFADEFKMPGGKILYYNGLPTIKQKTAFAKEKASGIMIWQLQGDAHGEHSLLQAINEVAYGKN